MYSLEVIEPCDNIISKNNWTAISYTSEETSNGNYVFNNLIDSDTLTSWSTKWELAEVWPYEFQIGLGAEHELSGVSLFATNSFNVNNHWYSAYDIEFLVSNTPNNWGAAVNRGKYAFTANERINTFFDKKSGRYLKAIIHSTQNQPGGWAYLSELDVFGNCNLSVGTNEVNSNLGTFNVYPNPVDNEISIELSSLKASITNVYITTLGGSEVRNEIFSTQVGMSKLKLGNLNLSPGMYLIRIESIGEYKQQKFVVR
jgi:hypothetical protein